MRPLENVHTEEPHEEDKPIEEITLEELPTEKEIPIEEPAEIIEMAKPNQVVTETPSAISNEPPKNVELPRRQEKPVGTGHASMNGGTPAEPQKERTHTHKNVGEKAPKSKGLSFSGYEEQEHETHGSKSHGGKSKGGKGLGKRGAKRHRKVLRDNIQGITKPAIRRIARRGGVKRLSGLIYEETRGVLRYFLEKVIRDAVTYTEHGRRKTVTTLDVVHALKRNNIDYYGAH
jgi:histone H4